MPHSPYHAIRCLLFVTLFLMSVSVQPVMAAEAINGELDRIQTLQDSRLLVSGTGPAASGSSSITIREIDAGRLRAHTESAGSIREAGASEITIRTGNVELVTRDPLVPSPLATGSAAEGSPGSAPAAEPPAAPDDAQARAQLATELANLTAKGYVLTGGSSHLYETKLIMEELKNATDLQRSAIQEKGYTFESADTLRSEHAVRYYSLTNSGTGAHILMMAVRQVDSSGNPLGKQNIAFSPVYYDESSARVHASAMEAGASGASGTCNDSCFAEYMDMIREYIALGLAVITAMMNILAILVAIVGASVALLGGPLSLGVLDGAISISSGVISGINSLFEAFLRGGAEDERRGDLYMRKTMAEQRKTIVIWNTLVPGHDNILGPLFYRIYQYNVCRCLIEPMEGGPAIFLWDYQYRFANGDNGKNVSARQYDLVAVRLYANTTAGLSGSWILEDHGRLTQKDTVTVTTVNGTFNAWLFEATNPGAQNITLRYDPGAGSAEQPGSPVRYHLNLTVRQSTWNITTVDTTPPQNSFSGNGMYTSLVFGTDGTPHISYYAPCWGGVRYATRSGDTWKAVTVAGSRGTFRTSIALSPRGDYPAFTYSDSDPTWNIGDMNYAYWNGKTWNWEHIITPGGGSDFRSIGMYNSLRFDSGGTPHVAFNSGQDMMNSVWYATRGYDKKWHVTNIRPPLGEDTGNNPSLALTRNDKARIAYRAGVTLPNRQDLSSRLWYGEEKNDGGFTFQVVDDEGAFGKTGHFASLALDSHDNPHISYYDENMQRLRYAHRDGNGTWLLATIDNGADAGSWCSIALDNDDAPHIAYYDKAAGHLKYAVFEPTVGDWVTRTIDTSGNVGACTSIALDPKGHPGISYYDYTHAALKFAWEMDEVTPAPVPAPSITPTLTPTITDTPAPAPVVTTLPPNGLPAAVPTEVPMATPTPAGVVQGDPSGIVTATSPESPAGTVVSYSFEPAATTDSLSVHEVSFVPGQAVPESRCTVRKESPLPDFQLQGSPALYENIEIGWINPNAISGAAIGFSVPKAWLDGNHIDPANVVLMRQHDLTWAELPTTFERQEGDQYYYTATTPGFSYFAVTNRTSALSPMTPQTGNEVSLTVPTAGTAGSDPAIAGEIMQAATIKIRAASPAPVSSPEVKAGPALDTIPLPVTTGPESGLPLLWIAVAALVSVLGIAGFFVGRRMWWKHQNPALFRKYD